MHFTTRLIFRVKKNEGSLPFRRGFLVFRLRPAAVTRLGLFVIPLVKTSGIIFVLIRRDKDYQSLNSGLIMSYFSSTFK